MLETLQQEREQALQAADSILAAAERAKRPLTQSESETIDRHTATASDLNKKIAQFRARSNQAWRQILNESRDPAFVPNAEKGRERILPKTLSAEYQTAFHREFMRVGGGVMSAAMVEGSDSAGGYAIPTVVESSIVPLAPSDFAVRSLATVIPTVADLKIPIQTVRSSAGLHTEATADFGDSSPTLAQPMLSAFTIAERAVASLELAQDSVAWNAFYAPDIALAIQELEESKFIGGSGSGEPQGLIGNTGAGVTGVAAGSDTYASELLTATFDVTALVKSAYQSNAAWLMTQATGLVIRKAQIQTGLFVPAWTYENGQPLLHGKPVRFSDSMPAIAAGATPILYGSFAACYIIGDRGGPAIRIKEVQDATAAINALQAFMVWRRTDGRVRRSEAVQAITLT